MKNKFNDFRKLLVGLVGEKGIYIEDFSDWISVEKSFEEDEGDFFGNGRRVSFLFGKDKYSGLYEIEVEKSDGAFLEEEKYFLNADDESVVEKVAIYLFSKFSSDFSTFPEGRELKTQSDILELVSDLGGLPLEKGFSLAIDFSPLAEKTFGWDRVFEVSLGGKEFLVDYRPLFGEYQFHFRYKESIEEETFTALKKKVDTITVKDFGEGLAEVYGKMYEQVRRVLGK